MAHGDGLITVIAEAATSAIWFRAHMMPLYILSFLPEITILDRQLKTYLLESAVCALYDCLNPLFRW